jgi:hemoglobin
MIRGGRTVGSSCTGKSATLAEKYLVKTRYIDGMSRDTVRPPPSRDLATPGEIAEMVRRFYQDVAQDDVLGPVFDDVAQVHWGEHLEKLTSFWCSVLLGLDGYEGNPFRAHATINERAPFTSEHFDRWLQLFHDTVDLRWVGPNATRAVAFAHNVARVHSRQLGAAQPTTA